jgi:hypothetical protein
MVEKIININDQIQYVVTHGIISLYESIKLRRKSSNEAELKQNFEELLEQKLNGN